MDSKYANLPGIAHNEPDIYETPDVIEIEPELHQNESDSIQKIEISTKEAFDKYSKNDLNGYYVDFSDSISKLCSPGYLVDNNYLIKKNETPFQKYNRLLNEINSLKSDLHDFSNQNKESNDQENNDTNADYDINLLLKDVEKLQKNAISLHLGKVSSTLNIENFEKLSKKNKLIEQINEFKKLPDSKKPKEELSEQNNSITFKIFNDIDSLNLNDLSKLTDLNQRLSRLELILDSNANKDILASLTSNSENKSLLGLIEHLNNKVNLIDSQSVDVIESKLQWMIQKLNQLNEKKNLIDDNEKYNKINELYTKLVKWQELFAMFPKIVERLASLNELHKQASQFATTLSRLDTENLSMKQNLEANIDCINQIKTNLDSNLQLIRTNFDNLQNLLKTEEKN